MKLCFDIGAHKGEKTEVLKKLSEKVIAFEPNPILHDMLSEKYKNSNVIVDNRAISFMNGLQTFMISDYDYISTLSNDWVTKSRFSNDYKWSKSITVETVTLLDIINQFGEPNFIKLDVEGYENEILLCFNKLLDNTIISFEFVEEDKNKIDNTIKHLYNIGYNNFSFTFGDNIILDKNLNWLPLENFYLVETLNPEEREKWGMIYFKK